MNTLLDDLRYGLRMLVKSPGFTAVAVLTLALGIGANTAIFSVVDGVLIHPLPYAHSDRLVWVWGKFPGGNTAAVCPPDLADYIRQNHSFERLSAFFVLGAEPENLSINGHTEQVEETMVTSGFFETLGVKPLLGRTFAASDEQAVSPQAIILSYRLWREKFGGAPDLVGRTVVSDGQNATVVGIMPASFDFPHGTEAWFPAPFLAKGMQQRPAHLFRPIGLLKPGVTLAMAQADLDAIAAHLAEQYPDTDRGWSLRLEDMQSAIVGPVREPLILLLGAVALVLLIACVNVANLLLARNSVRQKEIAIRATLGARRTHILRQLLTESVLLAVVGGTLGLLLANWGVTLLKTLAAGSVPRLAEIQLNGPVLLFTAVLSLVTGIVFGIAPALQATRSDIQGALKEGGRTSAGTARQSLRSLLVVAEVSLSAAMLIGAGLLLNSLWRTLRVNPGFDAKGVLTTRIILSGQPGSDEPHRSAFFRDFFAEVEAMPGVVAAGGISELPLSDQFNDDFFTTDATPPKDPREAKDADFRVIAGDYFKAMSIPLFEGRLFTKADGANGEGIVIVDRSFAKRYYRKVDPIGKHILVYGGPGGFTSCEIVGVVGGIRHVSLQRPPRPTMYFPFALFSGPTLNVVVRSADEAGSVAAGVRSAVAALDPQESVAAFVPMQQIVSDSASGDRFNAFLLGLFGALALVLSAAGIYGVMSYAVTQRTHEIGIRLALGAPPQAMLGMVVRQGMTVVAVGMLLGLALAGGLTRLMANQLYGINAADPETFAAAVILLGGVALAACIVPARRAMRVDPMVALRYE
jgi:putative ABC transport system permease protein